MKVDSNQLAKVEYKYIIVTYNKEKYNNNIDKHHLLVTLN